MIVRLLVGDDRSQQHAARDYIAARCTSDDPAWIDPIVTVESVWILERRYSFSRTQIAAAFEKLLDTAELVFEDHDLIRAALAAYRDGAGFADALVAERNARMGCVATITFDTAAAKRLSHFTLLDAH
ncbi:MAG: type II toxin-antitoxin system VapC family toxin [Candidatus Eremiobacteraeota bacterium]|nr:type II toxin-antitoxin system VapC family toxin [Candidatus Eremiobacteraeota bacterium]